MLSLRLQNKSWIAALAVLLVAGATQALAQPDPAPANGGAPNIFYGAVPPNGEHAPVLVFVHGLSSNATYWWTQGNNMYANAYNAGFRTAFISMNADNTDNSSVLIVNAQTFKTLLPAILTKYGVEQVYVVGHSKGGLDVQVAAALDPNTLKAIRALFTIGTPNQGAQLATWAFGPGRPIAAALGLLTPGLFDIQPSRVQQFRPAIDQLFRSRGVPVYTLTGDTFIGANPALLITGPILKNISGGEKNDGLVTVSESKLDDSFAFDLGNTKIAHYALGLGSASFSFIKGQVDGLEQMITGFTRISTGGFGDRYNSWAWSQRWFKGKLYVGTGRAVNCQILLTSDVQQGTNFYPPKDGDCPLDPKHLALQAEIWQYTPETKLWQRVFQSPAIVPIGVDNAGQPRMTGRDTGFRDLFVYTEANGAEVLYAAGVTGNNIYGLLPEYAPDKYPPPRILRSTDGVTWAPIPQDPGTFMGDLVKDQTDINVVSYRSFASYKGQLFVTVTNFRGEGFIIASANPAAGNNAWTRVSPSNEELPVWDLGVFNNFLYVAGGDREGDLGYTVHKTDATGAPPYQYTPIITNGAWQPLEAVRSPLALTMNIHDGLLYIGTDRKTEMIRLYPDDSWDLIAGEPRLAPVGQKNPISGIGVYFGNAFSGHFWQILSTNNGVNMGTWDFSVNLQASDNLNKTFSYQHGFDLLRSDEGVYWKTVTRTGFGDGKNFGARSMEFTPFGHFIGTARPKGGAQIFLDSSVLDLNGDFIIDNADVALITAAIGQNATSPTDPRDLDRNGKITVLDARKLVTQCTFPGCANTVPAAARARMRFQANGPSQLTAAPEAVVGRSVVLNWQPVPGAVRYRVYRNVVRPISDFLGGNQTITVDVPGQGEQTFRLPQDVLSGRLDWLCDPKLDLPLCGVVQAIKAKSSPSAAPPGAELVGFPDVTEQIAIVTNTTYQEVPPTTLQSLYFVRAEDALGNLSEVSNFVGAPSKAAPAAQVRR